MSDGKINVEKQQTPTITPEFIKSTKKSKRKLIANIRQLYFINRWTYDEIAEALNIHPKVVKRYVSLIKNFSKKMLDNREDFRNDTVVFLWELMENYKYRVKRLWEEYKSVLNDKNRSKTKTEIIEQLRHEDRQMFEILQELGLMPQHIEKVLDNIIFKSFKDIPKEESNYEIDKNTTAN